MPLESLDADIVYQEEDITVTGSVPDRLLLKNKGRKL